MESQPQILNSGLILKTFTHVLQNPPKSIITGLPGLPPPYGELREKSMCFWESSLTM